MLVLRSSPSSPFVRKVLLAASLAGLSDRVEVIKANTLDPNDTLPQQNPLGKIPALITEDGTVLYDSRVIVEYLDHLAGGGKVIPLGPQRFEALRLQALADGIMDASVLRTYEKRFRPEELWHKPWTDRQLDKVNRALAFLEENPSELSETSHIGTIAVACALGYLDFRFPGSWRDTHPNLVGWLDAFAARMPEFDKTNPEGAPQAPQ